MITRSILQNSWCDGPTLTSDPWSSMTNFRTTRLHFWTVGLSPLILVSLSLDYKPLGQECSEQCHTHQGEEDADGPSLGDVARKSRDGAPLRDSPMSILDSSWGPSTTEAGDTKIVAAAALLRLFSERSTMGINLSVASGSSTPNLSSKKMRTTKEDSSSS